MGNLKMSRTVAFKPYKRKWFYYIDHKGMLFLEETEPKNYTSCLKDDRFLDFFFDNLKPNQTGHNLEQNYTWVSPCWGEMNFVRTHRLPVVFRLIETNDEGERMLKYAGTKETKFDPEKLFTDQNGFLVHSIEGHDHLKLGTFDPNLACEMAECLV